MNKILANLLVIIVTATVVAIGTYALLSDEAKSEGNSFSTGNADLKIRIPSTGCEDWSDSCSGETWDNLYPGWSNSYNVYLKNASTAPIVLKIIPYIEETGSSQELWENTYLEITWSDGSHSSGRQSLEDWKTNSTIELEPHLSQGQGAGPWVVKFDIPETVGNEIANASIEFNLVFNGIQVGEEEICETNADCEDNNGCTSNECVDNVCEYICQDGIPCDDENDNTINDSCVGVDGQCQCVGEPVGECIYDSDCDDDNQCTVDSCDSVLGCLNICQDGIPCDDGDVNTINDTCDENCLCQGCTPSTEVCDGVDNDCDGIIDEGLTGPLCLNQEGVCSGSRRFCNGAFGWVSCDSSDYYNYAASQGFIYQQIETICDGSDNDCNGSIDDGTIMVMCPLTANVLATACSSGNCEITACVFGYADIDGIYGNGCEFRIP